MAIRVGVVSECGPIRRSNQDAVYTFPNANEQAVSTEDFACFIVCDGMGHASEDHPFPQVVEIIRKHIAETIHEPLSLDGRVPEAEQVLGEIKAAFLKANQFLLDQDKVLKSGVAACVTAAIYLKDQVYVGHVGDTRAYKLTNGTIQQLTRDHTFRDDLVTIVESFTPEPEKPPYRMVLYRALGMSENMEFDLLTYPISKGDGLLLCSDGLYNYVTEYFMLGAILNHPPQAAAERLVALAVEHGSNDNISVIVAAL